ncbi:MAG: adenylate/guanylate cyclase domain-containing protein [Flavobacteriales bacterium]|nr:adenylate/guanylate cyclase domain-containing protein [Flavobacteriales bacterium]
MNAQGVKHYALKGMDYPVGSPKEIVSEKMHFSENGSYAFRFLTPEENLPTNSIWSVHCDANGLMWMGGGSSGLYSFDGLVITDYSHIPSLSDKLITTITSSSDGMLWIGTRGHGLVRFDGSNFTEFSDKSGLPGERLKVLCIHEDVQGRVWFGTQKQGVFCFEDGVFTHYPSLFGPYGYTINAIGEMEDGALWFGAWTGVISIFKEGEWTYKATEAGLKKSPIWSIIELDNNVLVSQRAGIGIMGSDSIRYFDESDGFCSTEVFDALETSNGDIWFASMAQELIKWDGTNVTCFGADEGLSPSRLLSLTEDNQGNIWVCSLENGLIQLTGEQFTHEKLVYQSTQYEPISLHQRDLQLWVGTSEGKLFRREDTSSDFELIHDFFKEIIEVEEDDEGNILIGTIRGAYKWDGEKVDTLLDFSPNSVYTYDFGKAPAHLEGLAMATSTGLVVSNETEQITFKSTDGLSSNHINAFETDKNGYFWCATNDGIACLPPAKRKFTMLNVEHGIPGAVISDLVISENEIWFSIKGMGILIVEVDELKSFVDEGKQSLTNFEYLSTDEGLSSNQPRHFLKMSDGTIWIGTSQGIDVFDAQSHTKKWNYSATSGLRDKGIDFFDPATTSNGGCVWIVGDELVHYSRQNDRRRSVPPSSSITSIDLMNQEMDWRTDSSIVHEESYWQSFNSGYKYFEEFKPLTNLPEGLTLGYDQNNLTFHFEGVDWVNRNRLYFEYLLEGNDNAWNRTEDVREATYQNLKAGSYSFRLVAVGNDGVRGEEARFRFTVLPPFWQTNWFYLLCVIGTILVFIGIFRWRTYKLRKENVVLEKKVESRTKDLRLEQEKSEKLLLNILPKRTAAELKEKGKAETIIYENVSVLFSDFIGFTQLTETMNPQELVIALDAYFKAYDKSLSRYGVEKIKTIGDAYMCASGLPKSAKQHALQTVGFGLEMINLTNEINSQREKRGEKAWGLRIGTHSGPVIAGVVGQKKFAYDIWGDTVNVASRMESSGEGGELNISETTYQLVKAYVDCEPRGKIIAKNKGELNMYFVKGFKSKYADTENPRKPGAAFFSLIYGDALNVLS